MKYVDKIYGAFEFTGVIEQLIKTSIFQRLKKVHQAGAISFFQPKINHTRFDHSIGVMLLIKKLGGNMEEQIAGLLHDISHTAFSHLIDYVLDIEEEDYHEKRFEEVLRNEELGKVLQENGFEWSQFVDLAQYQILEYPLPNLSADRIDYTLRDLYQIGVLAKEEIDWFLNGLQIFDNRIVLKSVEYGQWYQEKYHFLVEEYFEGKDNKEANLLMKRVVKKCLEEGIIEESDFYFDDFYLIEKMEAKINLSKLIKELKEEGSSFGAVKTKKRSVNPEILVNNQVVKLSAIN